MLFAYYVSEVVHKHMIMKQINKYKDETQTLFDVVTDYTYALDTLDNYDYDRLTIDKTTKQESFHATYFRSGIKRKIFFFFCIPLTYSYLCAM